MQFKENTKIGYKLKKKGFDENVAMFYSTNNPVQQNVDSVIAFRGVRSLKLSVDRTSTAEFSYLIREMKYYQPLSTKI